MDGTIDPTIDYVGKLSDGADQRWPTIRAARAAANNVRNILSQKLVADLGRDSGDIEIVVFGSLARGEWTSGSDVDWTLLIDGQAAPEHRNLARRVASSISEIEYEGRTLPAPGTEGIFGSMAFSHDIIHHIGGQADSNRNTTQRILLLLESCPIRNMSYEGGLGPYERVTRQILYRYLHDDTNFAARGATNSRIPRFLLNDIIRYWRTMCVDFAYKEWEQAGQRWALRNIKLRMSRKLLFVSGLLTIFSCSDNASLNMESQVPAAYIHPMQSHLMNFVQSTPLDIIAWTLNQLETSNLASQLLDRYEQFVSLLDNEANRNHLRELTPNRVYADETFLQLREVSHQFQSVLTDLFFLTDSELRDFIIKYGVF